ncbi:MAG: hypothetical protein A3F80_04440 [Candidatus Melainabacteria bacterium RIFCSPLOWO2_12_FULL_35_11]|nr:MAG: hypothetical protein A3F80_04440 [Candidatus Melainabacteria bacterium RIFCSPLOWO2_12_FULL_35_11]
MPVQLGKISGSITRARSLSQHKPDNPARKSKPGTCFKPPVVYGGHPSPGASPEELPNIGSSSPPGKKEGASKDTTPPGDGNGTGGAKDLKNQKDTTSHPSNTWTTIKLLIGTALSGLGSFTAHFTNIFGEGTARNLSQIGFDFLTTLGFALTGASALSTYGTDKTHINTTSIN